MGGDRQYLSRTPRAHKRLSRFREKLTATRFGAVEQAVLGRLFSHSETRGVMAKGTAGMDASALDARPVVGVFRAPVFNLSEAFIQVQAAGLKRYQPLVIGLEAKGHLRPELQGRVLMLSSPARRLGLKLFGVCGPVPSTLRRVRPRLIHAHFATDGLTALPIARRLGLPLVTTLRGYDVMVEPGRMLASGKLSRVRYALLRRRLMARGDLFLAVSDALRAMAIERGFPAERTLTHYDGVRLDEFEPGRDAAEPGLILHVGRLVEKKGAALLVRALAEVRREHPGARLAILGEGPLEGALRRLAGELELGQSVAFLGALPHGEVRRWMRRAWVLAAPSVRAADGDREGLPTVVVEALASGLPVIGSAHAGIPEAIEHGRTGFVVAEGEVGELAGRLGLLLASSGLRAEMAGRSRALAEARFDAVRQGERLEAYYDRLIAGRGGLAATGPEQGRRECA